MGELQYTYSASSYKLCFSSVVHDIPPLLYCTVKGSRSLTIPSPVLLSCSVAGCGCDPGGLYWAWAWNPQYPQQVAPSLGYCCSSRAQRSPHPPPTLAPLASQTWRGTCKTCYVCITLYMGIITVLLVLKYHSTILCYVVVLFLVTSWC